MFETKNQTLRLPTDSDNAIETDAIETDAIPFEKVGEYDIIIHKEMAYVGLVVADPIRDTNEGQTVIRAPVLDYRAYSNLLNELDSNSSDTETTALKLLRSAAINTNFESRDPTETVTVVSDASREHLNDSG